MGARRHGQEGALSPIWKCNVFYALVVTAKRPIDELVIHYFHNLSSAVGASPPDLTGAPPTPTPLGDFRPETPDLPTPGKILGAYGP